MGELLEIASSIITSASRSVEVSAQNVANITTSGYRRRVDFSQIMAASLGDEISSQVHRTSIDFTVGKLVETGNTYDLALAAEGFFVVRTSDGALRYTRDGQFKRTPDGLLVDPRGGVLQADGGDLVLREGPVEILADGVLLEAGAPVGRLDIVDFEDPGQLTAAQDGGFMGDAGAAVRQTTPSVRQGALEMANVTTAAEMVSVMAALRRAESGQRIANVYDDLMGRVMTTFGQA